MATITNTAEASFGTATADWTVLPTYVSAHANSHVLAVRPLSDAPASIVDEQPLRYRAGDFDWSFPANQLVDDGYVDILEHYFTDFAVTLKLHSADPGEDGSGLELTAAGSPGYADAMIAAGGWTIALS